MAFISKQTNKLVEEKRKHFGYTQARKIGVSEFGSITSSLVSVMLGTGRNQGEQKSIQSL